MVNPAPNVSVTTSNSLICVGQSVILTSSGANVYLWSTSAIGSIIMVSPTVTTVYNVTGTNANGCTATFSITQNVSICTEFGDPNKLNPQISIYPNPNNGLFAISLPQFSENTSVHIFNSLGQLLIHEKLNSEFSTFNLQNYSNGIYFIKVVADNVLLLNSRIIKE